MPQRGQGRQLATALPLFQPGDVQQGGVWTRPRSFSSVMPWVAAPMRVCASTDKVIRARSASEGVSMTGFFWRLDAAPEARRP